MNYCLSLSLSFFWSLVLNEEKIWIKSLSYYDASALSLFLSLSSLLFALLLQIFFLSVSSSSLIIKFSRVLQKQKKRRD